MLTLMHYLGRLLGAAEGAKGFVSRCQELMHLLWKLSLQVPPGSLEIPLLLYWEVTELFFLVKRLPLRYKEKGHFVSWRCDESYNKYKDWGLLAFLPISPRL